MMETCQKCGITQDPEHPVCPHMMGRKGGRKVAERGRAYFVAMGRKGGSKTVAERGHAFFEEIGKKGGAKIKALIEAGERPSYEEIGRKGGAVAKSLIEAGRRTLAEEKKK